MGLQYDVSSSVIQRAVEPVPATTFGVRKPLSAIKSLTQVTPLPPKPAILLRLGEVGFRAFGLMRWGCKCGPWVRFIFLVANDAAGDIKLIVGKHFS